MQNRHRRILAFGIAVFLPLLDAKGTILTWDIDSTTAGAQGGSSNWLTALRWLDGGTNKTWIAGSDATFGGAAGTVTLNSDTSAGALTFQFRLYHHGDRHTHIAIQQQ